MEVINAHLIEDIDKFLQEVNFTAAESSKRTSTDTSSIPVSPPPPPAPPSQQPLQQPKAASHSSFQYPTTHTNHEHTASPPPASAAGSTIPPECVSSLCHRQRQHLSKELRRATELLKASMSQWEAERQAHQRTQRHLQDAKQEIKALRKVVAESGGVPVTSAMLQSPRGAATTTRNAQEEESTYQDTQSPLLVSPVHRAAMRHPTGAVNDQSMQPHDSSSALRELFERAATSSAKKRYPSNTFTSHPQAAAASSVQRSGMGHTRTQSPAATVRLQSPARTLSNPNSSSSTTAFSTSSPRFYPPIYGTTTPQRDQGHSFCYYQTSTKSGLESVTRQEAAAILQDEDGAGLRSPGRHSSVLEERQMGFALDALRRRLVNQGRSR